jgi:predicted transcriptional regulator
MKSLSKVLPFPECDDYGHYPAVAYGRVSIARDIIKGRLKDGLTQKALANLAGIRVETLCRIETGKHTPSVTTIERIERALSPVKRKKKLRSKAGMNS